MLYARQDGVRTIVAAAGTPVEFEAFDAIINEMEPRHFVSMVRPDAVDLMSENDYRGFRKSPYVFMHYDVDQRNRFAETCALKVLSFHEALAERQRKMLASDLLDPYVEGVDERSIAQIHGLDKYDRWDKRSDEEKAKDEEWRKEAEKLRKAGKMSSDSFAPTEEAPSADDAKTKDRIHVSKIEAVQEQDGKITVTNVSAHKITQGDAPVVDTSNDLRIASDGSASIFHRLDVTDTNYNDTVQAITQCGFDAGETIVAGSDTATGCWIAVSRQDHAIVLEEALRGMGLNVSRSTVNELGEVILPSDVRVVEEAITVEPPRPWNGRQAEIDAMDDDARKEWLKAMEASEFLFAGDYHGPKHGCSLFIAPKSYFKQEGEMYPHPLNIAHLLPSDCKEIAPGQYSSMSRDWVMLGHDLHRKGFTESLMLRIYVNNL